MSRNPELTVRHLLNMTVANGCTPAEAATARAKAEMLAKMHSIRLDAPAARTFSPDFDETPPWAAREAFWSRSYTGTWWACYRCRTLFVFRNRYGEWKVGVMDMDDDEPTWYRRRFGTDVNAAKRFAEARARDMDNGTDLVSSIFG